MPEFYVIIARTNFFPIFGRGLCAPFPTILYAPPVSYAYLYLGNMLIAKFTNIIFVPVCIVGKCPWVIDWSCSRWRHVDVIMVTWWFLCKVLLFRQCSPSDVVLSSRIVDPAIWRHWWRHHVIIFVTTLGLIISETKPDDGMVPMDSL